MLNILKKSLFCIGATTAIFAGGLASATDNIDVKLIKSASVTQVAPGDSITYTLNIENLSNNAVESSNIKDLISNKNIDLMGATFLYDDANDSCKVTRDEDPLVAIFEGDYISCDIAKILPNTSRTIKYTVPVKDTAVIGEEIKNTATMSTDGEPNENLANNRSSTSTEIVSSANIATSDISITKSSDKTEVSSGDKVEYTLTYKNAGALTAENVIIQDVFDNEKLDSSSFTLISPTNVDCKIERDSDPLVSIFQGDYIECKVGNISDENVYQIKYTMNTKSGLADGTTITNTAVIKSDNETETENNNKNSNTVTIKNIEQTSDISIEKTANKSTVESGRTVEYTLVYKNIGDLKAKNIVIKDLFDVNFNPDTFVLDSSSDGICKVVKDSDPLVAVFQNGEIECNIGDFAGNKTGVIKYSLTTKPNVADGTQLKNIATISSENESDSSDKSNNSDRKVVVVQNIEKTSDLSIAKSSDKTEVKSGDKVEYTLIYKNTKKDNTELLTAKNVIIQDVFDNEKLDSSSFTLISPTNADCTIKKDNDQLVAIFQGSYIECEIGDISDEKNYEIKYTINTKSGLADGTTITNTAVIKSDNETGLDVNNTANNAVTIKNVEKTSDISIQKTANKTTIKSGEIIEYTLAYKNSPINDSELLTAKNIIIKDTFDNNQLDISSIVFDSSVASFCTVKTNTVTSQKYIECIPSDLKDVAVKTIKYSVKTKSGLANGTKIKNIAVISSSNETELLSMSNANGDSGAENETNNTDENIITVNNVVPTATPVPTATATPVPTATTTTATHSTSSSSGGSGGGCNTESTIDLNINGFIKEKGANDSTYSDATIKNIANIAKNSKSEATYKVIILNKGSSYAYKAKVEMKFISANITQSDISNIDGAILEGGIFTITKPIPANGNAFFTFDTKLDAKEGTAQSKLTIKSFETDYKCPKIKKSEGIGRSDIVFIKAGNKESVKTNISTQEISRISTGEAYRLTKTADKTEVKAGEIIEYTLSIKNTGKQDFKNVMLFDIFPKEYLEPIDGAEKRLVDPTTLKFKRKFLPVGDVFTVKIKMKVKSHILAGTKIVNILKAGSQTILMKDKVETTTTVISAQQGSLQNLYTPNSNAGVISRPRKLIQTGLDAPMIPFGFALIFAGMYVYNRRKIVES